MKYHMKALATLIIFSISLSLFAQEGEVVVIGFKRVEASQHGAYLDLLHEWKKVQEARIEQGYITGFQMWEKMYSSVQDGSTFISVTRYENIQKANDPGFLETLNDVYPKKKMEKLIRNTLTISVHLKTEIIEPILVADSSRDSRYLSLFAMNVETGKGADYEKMEENIFKPMHEENIRLGNRNSWSIWRKWPRQEADYQYLAVNGYDDLGQMETDGYEEVLKTVHPDMDMEELTEIVLNTRITESIQIWRLIYSVLPE